MGILEERGEVWLISEERVGIWLISDKYVHKHNSKLYTCFIDFRKVYDSI